MSGNISLGVSAFGKAGDFTLFWEKMKRGSMRNEKCEGNTCLMFGRVMGKKKKRKKDRHQTSVNFQRAVW